MPPIQIPYFMHYSYMHSRHKLFYTIIIGSLLQSSLHPIVPHASYTNTLFHALLLVRSSGRPVVRSSGRPVVRSSGRPVVRSSGRPVVPSSRRPVVPSSRRPVVPSSRRPVVPSSRRPVVPSSRRPVVPQCTKCGQLSFRVRILAQHEFVQPRRAVQIQLSRHALREGDHSKSLNWPHI